MKSKDITRFDVLFAVAMVVIVLCFWAFLKKEGVPSTERRVFVLPLIFAMGMVYLFLVDGFLEFKNRTLGFSFLVFFSCLSEIGIWAVLHYRVIPMPQAGDSLYDMLIVVVFFVPCLYLPVFLEGQISKYLRSKKRKSR